MTRGICVDCEHREMDQHGNCARCGSRSMLRIQTSALSSHLTKVAESRSTEKVK